MKNVLIASFALVLFVCAVSMASAAEPISNSTLNNMGLSGMQQLSDNDGLAIRGKGTHAAVWGGSTAMWSGGQVSNNNYAAEASWIGKHSSAQGKSLSFAGVVQADFAQDPTGSALSVQVIGGIAGGSAHASAH